MLFSGIFVFIIGALVGSFLNVLVLRYNTGLSVVRGRSFCFSCGKVLGVFDLVPIASYLALRGRCRSCGAKISSTYALLELATGLFFLFAFLSFGISTLLGVSLFAGSLLLAIAVYDMRHKIIPDGLVFTYIALSLAFLVERIGPSWSFFVHPDFLAGVGFFAFFAALWFVSRGTWMGFGDAKLVLGIGWFLGLDRGLAALFIAFLAGAIVGTILLLTRPRSYTIKHEIPFAPYLVLGFFIVLLTPISIHTILALFGSF